MPGPRPAERPPAPSPSDRWIPPTKLPWPEAHDALFVPRRFRTLRWILGGGALLASAWLLGFMMSGPRSRTPPQAPALPAPSAAAAAKPAPAAPGRATAHAEAPDPDAQPAAEMKAGAEAKPARTTRAARRAPEQTAARRPRFGPNQSPLIE
jgi:hypothetical protein